jgi:hypothetical protein
MSANEDFDLITEVLTEGSDDTDTFRLAKTTVEVGALLVRKNQDYGSSGMKSPVLMPNLVAREALLCRMSDKVARIAQLADGSAPQVADEKLEDTIRDLAGYCILWLTAGDADVE